MTIPTYGNDSLTPRGVILPGIPCLEFAIHRHVTRTSRVLRLAHATHVSRGVGMTEPYDAE